LHQAGVRSGDSILSIDGKKVNYFVEHNLHIFNTALKRDAMSLLVERDSRQESIDVDFSELKVRNFKPSFLTYEIGLLPVRPTALNVIDKLVTEFPAEQAGLQVGDEIVRINGELVDSWLKVVTSIKSAGDGLMDIGVSREGAYKVFSLRPRVIERNGKFINQIGIYPKAKPISDDLKFHYSYSSGAAFGSAVSQTWDMSALTLRMLWKMLVGQASYKNISGPVSIASFTGEALQISWEYYLSILAVISISLAVMNLLPIPMLDGGHLLYYAVEAVTGKPVSEKAMLIGQKIGLLFLACLMSLAFYNDIFRLIS